MDSSMLAVIFTILALIGGVAFFLMGQKKPAAAAKKAAPEQKNKPDLVVKNEPVKRERMPVDMADEKPEKAAPKADDDAGLTTSAESEAARLAAKAADAAAQAKVNEAAAQAMAAAPVSEYAALISSNEYADPFSVDPHILSFLVGSEEDEIKRIVTVTNNTPERAVFKVKTNNPKRYLVKPSITFVSANETSKIEITLREREVDKIAKEMKEKGRQRATVTDKFLIQWMNVDKKFYFDEAYFHLVKESSWIEKAQKLIKSVPKNEQKQRFKFVRLKVQYELPSKPSATNLETTAEVEENEDESTEGA